MIGSERPPPGFYWAKLTGDDEWTVVEVDAGRVRSGIGWYSGLAAGCQVTEWGPRLEPPR